MGKEATARQTFLSCFNPFLLCILDDLYNIGGSQWVIAVGYLFCGVLSKIDHCSKFPEFCGREQFITSRMWHDWLYFWGELQLQACFDSWTVRYLYIRQAFYAYLTYDFVYMGEGIKGRCWWLMRELGYLHSVIGRYVPKDQKDNVFNIHIEFVYKIL